MGVLSENAKSYAKKYWGREVAREEAVREEIFPLVDIQTTIAWAIINKYIKSSGTSSLLDAGAGIGRYSLPLAKFGISVTHLDVSEDMIKAARKVANREDLTNVDFVLGDITDLSAYENNNFDMTISFDAPVSYTYPNQEQAIKELCRVTDEYLILMVSNRNGLIPFMVDFDLSGEYLPPDEDIKIEPFYITKQILKEGVEVWPDRIKEYLNRSGNEAPNDYSFNVSELTAMIEKEGFEILDVGGPGALARSVKPESLEKIRNDERLFNEFIKLSLIYDFDKNNVGLGAVNLLVVAKRKQ